MFGFLLSIKVAIDFVKNKAQEAKSRSKSYREKLFSRIDGEEKDDDVEKDSKADKDETKKKVKTKKRLKTAFYMILSGVLTFFETFPVFSIILLAIIFALLIVAVIVIVSIMTTITMSVQDKDEPKFNPDAYTDTKAGTGKVLWTEEQLSAQGQLLTDREKNMYRLGILARKASAGYDGKKVLTIPDDDLDTDTLIILGIASTETSMNFYQGGKQYDITKVPSDINSNSKGYGFFGLRYSDALSNYYSSATINLIKNAYTPQTSAGYERDFAPWGVAMGTGHLQTKFPNLVGRKDNQDLIEKKMTEFGITNNRSKVKAMVSHFLIQAQYHGAIVKEYEGYISFYLALYCATSENDAERSFDKWAVTGGFDESSFRLAVLGTTRISDVDTVSTPAQLNKATTGTTILLNGKPLTVPLWRYLWSVDGNDQKLRGAWSQAQHFAGPGVRDRVLNYHYGFNSYLQGMHVRDVLADKLVGGDDKGTAPVKVQTGKFKETPGQGQAVLKGNLSTEQYIANYYSNGNSSRKAWIDKLKTTWGKSSFLEGKGYAASIKYTDSTFGVPFYGQNSKYEEEYGFFTWFYGTGDTFNRSGCMVYSAAYTISSLTGRMINPTETAVLMAASNSLVSQGISMPNMPKLYTDLGLNAKYYDSGLASFEGLVTALKQGGVAMARVKPGYFTKSSNHFIVLTSIDVKNGKRFFTLYTPSHADQSMQVYSEEQLKQNMHNKAIAIWK